MYDESDDEMDGFVCLPCKKCGSTGYRNTDKEEFKDLPDGRTSVQPSTCDQCTFDLMMNKQKELH